MKWTVVYGTCDGTGPYRMFVEEKNIIDAILKSRIDPANVMAVNPTRTGPIKTKDRHSLKFLDWCKKVHAGGEFAIVVSDKVSPEGQHAIKDAIEQSLAVMAKHLDYLVTWVEEEVQK